MTTIKTNLPGWERAIRTQVGRYGTSEKCYKRSLLSRSLNQAVASDDGEAGDRGDCLTHC